MLCFLVIALVDFFWQRWSFFKSMRMSKHEVKKEFIQQEGDPEIKLERRRIQQETLEALSSANVVDASVVITNPSHLAVALRYQESKDLAPRVIAKGVGKNAKAIIGEARRMTIPIMRNVPLARDLQWLEIDEEIPVRLYDSVAEVLTFINELNEKNSGDTT
jgi:flagellar biosynthetic protein FlhB